MSMHAPVMALQAPKDLFELSSSGPEHLYELAPQMA
jgi:hypothetical protein